jgi:hypothetical protein
MNPIDLMLLSQIVSGVSIVFIVGLGISYFQLKSKK